jgi:hypothetical protein
MSSYIWDDTVKFVFDLASCNILEYSFCIERDMVGINQSVLWWNSTYPTALVDSELSMVSGDGQFLVDFETPRYIPVFDGIPIDSAEGIAVYCKRFTDRVSEKIQRIPPTSRMIILHHGLMQFERSEEEKAIIVIQWPDGSICTHAIRKSEVLLNNLEVPRNAENVIFWNGKSYE